MPYSKEDMAKYGKNKPSRPNKRNRYQDFSEIVVGDVVLNTTDRLFKGKVLETDDSTLEVTIRRDHDKVRFKTRLWRGLIVRERYDTDICGRKKGKNRKIFYE
tara:strand:- start:3386 stop:3694 length:309 start_codon:yes stop_codon:yes gene_type:complete